MFVCREAVRALSLAVLTVSRLAWVPHLIKACKLGVLFELSSGAQVTKVVQSCFVQMRHTSTFSSFLSSAVSEEIRLLLYLLQCTLFLHQQAKREREETRAEQHDGEEKESIWGNRLSRAASLADRGMAGGRISPLGRNTPCRLCLFCVASLWASLPFMEGLAAEGAEGNILRHIQKHVGGSISPESLPSAVMTLSTVS